MLNMFVLIQDMKRPSQQVINPVGTEPLIPGYKLEFSGSKFVFAHIVHTTAEVGIESRPLAQESETLPLGHRDLRLKIC